MISAEQFLKDQALRAKRIDSPQAADHPVSHIELPQEIRDAANRGWQIFPILSGSLLASNADALADTATSDLSILENLSLAYPASNFGLCTGKNSSVWVLESREPSCSNILYQLAGITSQCADDYWEDGITLLSRGATSTYAFFKWPMGASSMIRSGGESDPRLILHGNHSWVPLPPSVFSNVTHNYINHAEVSETPAFLVDLLFEFPAINPAPAEPQQYSVRPDHPGCSQHLKHYDVIRRERKTVQFSDPVAWRSKSEVIRRR